MLRHALKLLGTPFGLLKPLVPQTLLGRSILIVLVPLLLLQIVAMYVLYDRHYLKLTNNLAENIVGDIETVVFMFERSQTPSQQDEIFSLSRRTHRLITSFEFDTLPERNPPHTGTATDRRLAQYLLRLDRPFLIDSISNEDEVLAYVSVQDDEGYLAFKIDKSRLFTSTILVFAFWVFAASLLLFGIATVFLRNQVRPLRRLSRAAEQLGRGQQVDLPIEGSIEVRQAATSFLKMQSRLNRYISQRTAMLSGVSHDLRTPLTRMKLELALLKDKITAKSLNRDVEDMEHMVNSYLSFARGESSEEPINLDLSDFVEGIANSYKKISLQIVNPEHADTRLTLRPQGLKRALINIIENALKYADKAQIDLKFQKDSIELNVSDDGPGIPFEERENVFQPFYRMEASRNSDTGGQGLGLSIVQDFVQRHGGEISLNESELGGLKVAIKLPR